MITLLLLLLVPLFGTPGAVFGALFCALTLYIYCLVTLSKGFWKKQGVKYVKSKLLRMQIVPSKSLTEQIQDIYRAFPRERYIGTYQFLQPILMVKDPNLIKQITVKQFEHFPNHQKVADVETDPFWCKNLFAARDERWHELRSTLSPCFTSSKMKVMFALMDECARQFVEHFKRNQSAEVIELEMKDTISRYTNDVIASTAFGLSCDSLKNQNNDFYIMGKRVGNFSGLKALKIFIYGLSPTLARLFRVKIFPSSVSEYFSKIISETVKIREEKHIARPDMIHLLMEARKVGHRHEDESHTNEGFASVSEQVYSHKNKIKPDITVDDITSQALIFFVAGFDSVSTLISFALYELAVNPDIQERLRDEILWAPEKITYETLLELKYLDMVISETLRRWPPTPLTDRQVKGSITIQPERPGDKPLRLEEGQICWLPIYSIHNDPQNYPEPDKFDPERFSDETRYRINPSTYIAFGAGPRNCIGSRFALLETKLILFHLLRTFQVVPVAKTHVPMVLDKYQVLNLHAKDGLWLGLKKVDPARRFNTIPRVQVTFY